MGFALWSEQKLRWVFGGAGALCFAGLLAFETLTDPDDFDVYDFLGDALTLVLTIGAAVGFGLVVQRLRVRQEEQQALIQDLDLAREEGRAWRTRAETHLANLKTELDRQFAHWGMSAAEREVGLLILKGLSHKEIAILRKTSDATVRQQAQAIYRKSDLPGKTAFCAYFLEDLMAFEPSAEAPQRGLGPSARSVSPQPVARGASSAHR